MGCGFRIMQNSYYYQHFNTSWLLSRVAYLAHCPSIITVHILHLSKPQSFVNGGIWNVSATLEITLPPFSVRFVGHRLEEHPPDSLPLFVWQHCDYVAEIVSLWIVPQLRLCCCLSTFPNIVPLRSAWSASSSTLSGLEHYLDIKPSSTPPEIHHYLSSPKNPCLHPFVPAFRLSSLPWWHPTSYSKHFSIIGPRPTVVGLYCGRNFFGNVEQRVPDPPSAADAKRGTVTSEGELHTANN